MYKPGDIVMITKGIYFGRIVEIAKIVSQKWDHPTLKYNGYAVRGLTTGNATMSTFWDDELEEM